MAAWAASRRNRDADDRFVDHVESPKYAAYFCNLDESPSEPSLNQGCTKPYDPTTEVAFVRIVPGVEAVAETNVVPVEMDVAGQQFQAAIGNTRGDGIATLNGNPVIVAGRAPSAPDEFAVNEAAVAGFPLGTTVTAQHLRLVGIARFPVDFAVAENKLQQTTGIAFTSLACWQMWGSRVGTAGSGWLPPRPGAGSALAARPIGVHRATLEGWSHAAPANRVPYVVAREAWPGRRRVASVMAPTTKGTASAAPAR